MASGKKGSRGRSAFRANIKSTKAKNSDYEKKIGAIRARAAVGELIDFQFLFTSFPETFPKGRPHFAELFLADAKRKGHLREDGRLAPWEKVKDDPIPGVSFSTSISSEPVDPGTITVVKPLDYSALRRELYTRGTLLRLKEEVSAASLQARGEPFSQYTRGALGAFLVWLQEQSELEPFNGKKRRLSALGLKAQTKMNPGKVQPLMPSAVAPALLQTSFVPVDAPTVQAVVSPAAEPEAATPSALVEPIVEPAVEAEEVKPQAPKKPRTLPPIGIGDIPTGNDFNTRDRRCLGMLILSVVSAAGGIRLLVNAETLYPKVRQLCGLGVEVKGNALGRFFYALYNLGLVESFGERTDEGGYQYKVTEQVYQRVLRGEFGELPLERFGVEVKESHREVEAPEVTEAAAPDDLVEVPADGVVDDMDAEAAVVEGDEPPPVADEAPQSHDAPEAPAREPVEPTIQPAPEVAPSTASSARRVMVRRSALVPRQIYDANLAELRATRAAMEALQEQIRGLPEQLQDIVSEALRRQAEDFERRLADAHAKHAEELSSRDEALAHLGARLGRSEADLCSVGELEERMAHMESQFGALTAFKKLLMAFAEQVK